MGTKLIVVKTGQVPGAVCGQDHTHNTEATQEGDSGKPEYLGGHFQI